MDNADRNPQPTSANPAAPARTRAGQPAKRPSAASKRPISGPVRQMRLILTQPSGSTPAAGWTLDPATKSRGRRGVAAARRALEAVEPPAVTDRRAS